MKSGGIMKVFVYGDKDILINYSKVIDHFGITGIFSRNIDDSLDCDALLLAGGGDILPVLYGDTLINCNNIDVKRDYDEMKLINTFDNCNKPILGICRGIQIINTAFGGNIIQDVKNTEIHAYDKIIGDKIHHVRTKSNTFLDKIYGKEFSVNSAHHQALRKIGNSLTVSAVADDGIIEAVENSDKKIYAVQFHPERMCLSFKNENTIDGLSTFEFFFDICRKSNSPDASEQT